MSDRIALIALTALVVPALAGCDNQTPVATKSPLQVDVTTARRETIFSKLRLAGVLKPKESVSVAFRIDGTISRRTASIGQKVAPGDVLAEVAASDQQQDVTAAQGALEAASVALKQSLADDERQQALSARGFVTKAKLESAAANVQVSEAALRQARSNLEIAKQRLQYASLRAGVAGTVTSVQMEVGQYVQSGQTVAAIAVDSGLQAVFSVSAAMIDSSGQNASPITVSTISDPSVATSSTFAEMSPIVDQKSGTVDVKLDVTNPPAAMTFGTAVEAEAQGKAVDGFKIPKAALSAWNGSPAVWLVDRTTHAVQLQPVVIETVLEDALVVDSGLKDGDLVVTRGGQFLSPGQIVDPGARS